MQVEVRYTDTSMLWMRRNAEREATCLSSTAEPTTEHILHLVNGAVGVLVGDIGVEALREVGGGGNSGQALLHRALPLHYLPYVAQHALRKLAACGRRAPTSAVLIMLVDDWAIRLPQIPWCIMQAGHV